MGGPITNGHIHRPIDVFLATQEYTGVLLWRQHIAAGIIQYWRTLPNCMVWVQIGMTQQDRRMSADEKSTLQYYIVADDDCLPQPPAIDFIHRAMVLVEKYPEYGVLSPLPTHGNIQYWKEKDDERNEDVFEHTSVGGIRFCRKGIVKEWPPQIGLGYDIEHGEAVRNAGKRSGYMENVKMNHICEGYSGLWGRSDN